MYNILTRKANIIALWPDSLMLLVVMVYFGVESCREITN